MAQRIKENEVRATAKYVRVAPRKARLVVDQIRNKSVEQALELLQFNNRAAAVPVAKVVNSAVANAENNHGLRGAEFAKECREAKLFEIDDVRFEKLYHACKFHTHERSNDDPTISTCYDADRLDLGRVGIPLDPKKMATSFGSQIASLSLKQHVSVFGMREWLRAIAPTLR